MKKIYSHAGAFFFIAIAGLFIYFGISGYLNVQRLQKIGITTNGKVVLVDRQSTKDKITYNSIIEFQLQNNEPERFTAQNTPDYPVGTMLEILYDPVNPRNAMIKNNALGAYTSSVVMTIVGIILIGITSFFILFLHKRKKEVQQLESTGTRITATVMDIQPITSTPQGSFSSHTVAWQIRAQYLNPTDNKVYIFMSDGLPYDPSPYLQEKSIQVLVNPMNWNQYHVITDALPKLA